MASPVLQFKRGNIGAAATIPALRPGEPAFTLDKFDLFVGLDTSVAGNKFFGSHRYWTRENGTNSLNLKLVDKDGTNYVAVKSPDTLGGNVTYVLPGTQGAVDTVLKNDGSGNLSWGTGIDFAGINTFTNTTDNTLGDPNTGAFQIDGGLGVEKNVTIGAGLSVAGQSYFIGTATFYGGQINLGDSDTDDIVVAGEFKSNLIPSDDATYNLGTSGKRWNNASFAGIVTASTGAVFDGVQIGINGANVIDTVSGNLTLNSAGGATIIDDAVTIQNNLTVNGNVTVGGTTITLRGEDVYIENKDIILGYTTSITPNDDTANHAGVAIASTVGTPLANFDASGINTLPSTYKQLMWFKSGTLGFATDAFAFNYGVAIGTTIMADGVRLAVGTGVTVGDTSVSATNFYGALTGNVTGNASSADQVKTVTASDTNGTYHITFVDANNGSATNETVYTDDGIYYNPGANKLTTQHAELTGNLNVSGITTLAGNVNLGDSGSDVITVVGVTTFTTSNVYIDNQLFVGGIQVTGGAAIVGQDITARHLELSGIATVTGLIDGNGGAEISGYSQFDDVNINGGLNIVGVTTTGTLNVTGNTTLGDTSGDTVTVKGTATFEQTITGTATTATRATTVDTTGTTTNATYYATFVDTSAGENGEILRTGTALSLNASTGNVKSSGDLQTGSGYLGSANGTRGLYIYDTSGDVSFQGKAIVNSIRSATDSNNAISLAGRDVTLENNVKIVGVTTIGTGVGVTQFSASVSTGSSTSSVPTSSAVIDYVGTQIGNIDLTLGLTADSGGPSTVNTSQTLTISGTTSEVETSVSGQTVTIGLPNDVIVGTSLSAPTIKTATIQHQNSTNAITIDTSGNVTAAQNLTVTGDLYVSGNTTQVNTASLTVEDRTIELGVVNGSAPVSSTTWDLGVIFNYNASGAKKSGVIWEHADARFKFGSEVTAGDGTDNNTPQVTFTSYAPIEIESLWVNDCAGQSQVISCTGTERYLENITIDAGTF